MSCFYPLLPQPNITNLYCLVSIHYCHSQTCFYVVFCHSKCSHLFIMVLPLHHLGEVLCVLHHSHWLPFYWKYTGVFKYARFLLIDKANLPIFSKYIWQRDKQADSYITTFSPYFGCITVCSLCQYFSEICTHLCPNKRAFIYYPLVCFDLFS